MRILSAQFDRADFAAIEPEESLAAISPLPGRQTETLGAPGSVVELLAKQKSGTDRDYRQIWREGRIAVYEVHNKAGMQIGYELIVVRIQKMQTILGKQYPAHEIYPSNEDFGVRGWSFPIRQHELVFELARRMAASQCSYGRWMRATLSHWKGTGQLPAADAHAALVAANPRKERELEGAAAA
jgi:hypothetical protein